MAARKPLAHPSFSAVRLHELEYPPAGFQKDIYHEIYKALNAEKYPSQPRRLGYILPRDHGKSTTITHITPSWAALQNPELRIAIISESFDQAKRKLSQCRDTIEEWAPAFGQKVESSNYKEIELARESNHDVATITAAGLDSGITGGRFDLIIYDDVVSWKTQRTPARRDKIEKQFKERLNLTAGDSSVVVVVGTRKHPDDLYQFLIDNPTWDVEVQPAIKDKSIIEEGAYDVVTDKGNEYDTIAEVDPRLETITGVEPHYDAEVLWPERKPLEALLMDMLEASASGAGAPVWRREVLAEADALMGSILSEDMFSFVEPDEVPDNLPTYVGVDLAIEDDPEKAARNDTDYTAFARMKYDSASDEMYLLDVSRRRGMSMNKAIEWLAKNIDDPKKMLIEGNQAQSFFVQTAEDNGLPVTETTSTGKKEDRIISMSSRFESGKVMLVESGDDDSSKWESFASEWAEFPSGRHDDRLDAVEITLRGIEDAQSESSYALFSGN